jgi:hypothetical protein
VTGPQQGIRYLHRGVAKDTINVMALKCATEIPYVIFVVVVVVVVVEERT